MLNIKYIVDSTSDISKEYAKENDITVIGMPIIFEDGTTARDWVEMTHEEFYSKLTSSKNIPSTSQVPLGEMEDMFIENLEKYDAIVFITLSSKGSGTYQSANLAKQNVLEKYPDAKIEIIDSMSYSLYIPIMLDEAIRLQKEGKSLEEIVEGAKNARRHTDVLVVVDTLKYLEKGGRINKASLVAGTLLDLKPVLSVRKGVIESIDKFRGNKTIISKMVKKLKTMNIDEENLSFCIVHAQAEEKADQLWEAIKEAYPGAKLFMKSQLGATVGTHIGPGTVAVMFKLKEPMAVYDED